MKIDATDTVQAIGQLNFVGNVIPHMWYQHITKKIKMRDSDECETRPYLEAIVILSDIVYWYRPTEERDEESGQIVSIKKKFKSDKLQRSYQQMADMFGIGKDQARNAVRYLESKGLITLEYRTVNLSGLVLSNVLFIEPVPEKIKEINLPKLEDAVCPDESTPMPRPGHTIPSDQGIPMPKSKDTYTDIITEITHKELGAEIQSGANAPSDESLTPDGVSCATLNLADESFTADSCPVCNHEIILKNLQKAKAVCPHCNVGLYVKNIDGEIVCRPPQSMREERKRNRLIDLFPCPDEWKEFPYYARDKAAFKLLYETEKDDLLSALSWSVGQYKKGQMKYKDVVAAAIKATQKRLALKQSQPTKMSISDKAETSIERMARENSITVQQVMERLQVGGYVQS